MERYSGNVQGCEVDCFVSRPVRSVQDLNSPHVAVIIGEDEINVQAEKLLNL